MRVPKKAGEEVQIDYAGQMVLVIDPEPGEKRKAQIFVGVLGASGLIYAEAQWDQSLPNWIRAHVRMFDFFGGVPEIIRPDNLKTGVTKASRLLKNALKSTHYGKEAIFQFVYL